MDLLNLAADTRVIRPGALVRTVFEACVHNNVPALPYIDADDRISGKLSIRHIMKQAIPHYVVKMAHVLGDNIEAVNIPPVDVHALLSRPVEEFLLEPVIVSRQTPVIKALAIMEYHNTSYLFVADDGHYEGLVSRMSIAQRMLEISEMHQPL